ncbi:hypothetical protein kac65v162_gp033 [Nodularia phage vB_NspS-kac65v162]|jgi:hypothetical protein|uniref:Uncharacterized protein n=6 Tax=Ravarandavirus TaxID=2843444 RepID=A0A482MJZ6_9CAUD|nr:hypothetical protein HWA92_gp031 [Nodularia phage vB_NpeS-2AV2]YP_009844636.1 hypothetical protein HWC12_gp033 [Nodularia phage vB_NspS-kac65v151]YP_009844846.1 hypothetical protein HWC13_gp037 [Nodularia phage vB_NspS-kac68v161]QBQ73271.1 hypothetical protein kac65v161_gp033 [Nodularia phage vB_NspS-kac65v161]QBQ73477.1 hypothetical protein kac65v162_gp033 [Nodularia phage vB_NspS-kac65v162]QBQ73885.1 hypothetical protein kac68v162_gp037 [Nodularia phage vB_NspS-kac68v162]ALY07483.1 hypot
MANSIYRVTPLGEPISANGERFLAGQEYEGDTEINQRLVDSGYVELIRAVPERKRSSMPPEPTASTPVVTKETQETKVTTEEAETEPKTTTETVETPETVKPTRTSRRGSS